MRGPRLASRRVRRIVALALLAVPGCSGTGCGRCSSDSDESTSAAEQEGDDDDLSVPEGSGIEMLALGSKPRRYLRVARWPGLRYRATYESWGTFGVVGNPAVRGPKLTLDFVYEVLRGSADPLTVERDGSVLRLVEERAVLEDARFEGEDVPPEALSALNESAVAYRGSTLRQQLRENGGIESLSLELVGGAEPSAEVKKAADASLDMQRRFPFRLPPIPVGVGARWRFGERITINGIGARQMAEMSVREMGEGTARIHVTVRLLAPRQPVPHPLDPGKTAILTAFRGDGEGELRIDRLTGIPLSGRLATSARLTIAGEVAGRQESATFLASTVVLYRGAILGVDAGGNAAIEEGVGP